MITVEILGYGQGSWCRSRIATPARPTTGHSVVRVLGAGELSEEQGAALTDAGHRSML